MSKKGWILLAIWLVAGIFVGLGEVVQPGGFSNFLTLIGFWIGVAVLGVAIKTRDTDRWDR